MPCFSITFSWTTILLLCLWCLHTNSYNNPSDEPDHMGRQDKVKMITLTEELLKDAKVKQRHVHVVRNQHNALVAYDVGLIIGKIREKYKRMMDIYREAFDRKTNRTSLLPPAIRDLKLIHWIISMELVHAMEVDIDKLIQVTEQMSKKELKSHAQPGEAGQPLREGPATTPPEDSANSPTPGSELPKKMLRTSNNITEVSPKPKFLNEDELKQHYREQYKVRSGHDANWTLDEYYGVI